MKLIEALAFIRNSSGRIFAVEFVKRSDGTLRMMNCRTGVSKGVKGVGSYDAEEHNLIRVFDMHRNAFRTIPVEGIRRIKIDGEWRDIETNCTQGA